MSSASGGGAEQAAADALPPDTVHHLLSSGRRRAVYGHLAADGTLSVRELSERLATAESGEDPPPSDVRHSVYVSLRQNHLPKLADNGVVEFADDGESSVRLGPRAEAFGAYVEAEAGDGPPTADDDRACPNVAIAATAGLGVAAVLASEAGVPMIQSVQAEHLALVSLVSTVGLAVGTAGGPLALSDRD
jgi:hypothetical protein